MEIRVRRPFSLRIDEALEKGKADMPAVPDGLYLRRLASELDGAVDVERMGHGWFRATRSSDVLKKLKEGSKHAIYERQRRKWTSLI